MQAPLNAQRNGCCTHCCTRFDLRNDGYIDDRPQFVRPNSHYAVTPNFTNKQRPYDRDSVMQLLETHQHTTRS